MRLVFFSHSLLSDWCHRSAHFLRGVVSELVERGHRVSVCEPADAWSVQNLVHEHGEEALALTTEHFPALQSRRYDRATLDLDEVLDGADAVIVHEWSSHDLVRRIGAHRKRSRSRYALLFHDTHHRAVTAPAEMERYDLSGFDGVLAFCGAVKEAHDRMGWGPRAWVWREAADVRIFKPSPLALTEFEPGSEPDSKRVAARRDVVWIGNWSDESRANDLRECFLDPVRELRLSAKVFGVRYPDAARADLAARGVAYGGWLPNFHVPRAFAAFKMTVHVPRRSEAKALADPAIRVFEALACGVPLVSCHWHDSEGLFRAGTDYLIADDGASMQQHMRTLLSDPDARRELADRGRESILGRHTCAHRVDELLAILESFAGERSPGSRPNVSLGVFL